MAVAEGFNCISNLPSSIPVSFIRVSPPGEWRYSLVNRSIYLLFLFEVPFPSEIKANLIIIINNNNDNNNNNNDNISCETHSDTFLS